MMVWFLHPSGHKAKGAIMLARSRVQLGLLLFLLAVSCPRILGQSSQAPSPEDVIAKASPSVVLILVGQGGEQPSGLGSGLVVRPDGDKTRADQPPAVAAIVHICLLGKDPSVKFC